MNFANILAIFTLIALISPSVNADSCTVTKYEDVAAAVKNCDTLTIGDLEIPAETTLQLDLKDSGKLIFNGHLTHKVVDDFAGILVEISGKNVEISGGSGHLLDGLGPKHWKGANEQTISRPNFFKLKLEDSTVKNLNIKNCPNHCVKIVNSKNLHLSNIHIDNYDGYPGVAGDNYAKNTDGFDVSGTVGLRIEDSVVINQDDCVAAESGHDFVFERLHCNGSHGLSISIGVGELYDVQFLDCVMEHGLNAVHIKTHNDQAGGTLKNILYKNIKISELEGSAISVQENYPRGEPKANVPITNLTVHGVSGTMTGKKSKALDIICAKEGCFDFKFEDLKITGAKNDNECINVPAGVKC